MNFRVICRECVPNILFEKSLFVLISITDAEDFPSVPHTDYCLDVLRLSFHDLDKIDETGRYATITDDQAQKIAHFALKYENLVETIFCQCDAGISRSSGAAAALSRFFNGDDSFFFERYIPNRLVYRKVLNCLVSNNNGEMRVMREGGCPDSASSDSAIKTSCSKEEVCKD
jgi:hypothetical protein